MHAPIVAAALLVAQSWPGLWGLSRNADVAGAATAPSAFKELWRRPTAGGYSEIAVGSRGLFTMELRDGVDHLVAIDPATGRDQWSAPFGTTYKGHDGSDDGPIATPAVDGDLVFAVGPHGVIAAFDAATGRERWRHDLVAEFSTRLPAYGFGASPLVEQGLVIVPTAGPESRGLLAFERATGKLAWNAAHAKTPAYSSAVAATIGGVRQVIAAAGDRVFAVSPRDGRVIWSIAGLGPDQALSNPPIVLPNDRVLYSSWEQSVLLRVTTSGATQQASEVWRSTRLRSYNGPTVHRDGSLFAFAGPFLVCADAATGEIRWRERIGDGTLIGLGPHLLVLGQTSGELLVVRAAADRYAEVSRRRVFTPDVRSVTGPSLADGRMFLRNLREMVAFELAR